ncbi:alpha/beta fold hydrolase [Kribbella sp. NPDC051620]|uniref:alpha/beta fold hydrolase n=1 Tax=Kribbella sp. NPDC051620 TaxID=3364120 RepID=UPI0037B7109A
MKKILPAALAVATIAGGLFAGTTAATSATASAVEYSSSHGGPKPPKGFTERKLDVGGVGINFVEGGRGKTLVLLHGYPETWYAWHKVLPELARHYHVIAPDLRGAGGSDAPAGGYDKSTMAADVHGLLVALGRDHDIRLVGHDIGTMVAYAYAAAHPADVTKLALTEAPIPDQLLYSSPSLTPQGPGSWNLGFFNLRNGLPEKMIRGREAEWIDGFADMVEYNKDGVTTADAKIYGRYMQRPGHLRASLEWFRAFNQDVADNAINGHTKLTMPVLALGAQYSWGPFVLNQVRDYATNVTGGVVENSGHWLFEEKPAELTTTLLTFLAP